MRNQVLLALGLLAVAGCSSASDNASVSANVIASGPCDGVPSLSAQYSYPECARGSDGSCADPNCATVSVTVHDSQCTSGHSESVGCAPTGMAIAGHSVYFRTCDQMVIISTLPASDTTGLSDGPTPASQGVKWACN